MDEDNLPPNRHNRIRRPSSSLISSTTSPMLPVVPIMAAQAPPSHVLPAPSVPRAVSSANRPAAQYNNNVGRDIDDDVQPSSSTSSFTAPSFRRSINNNPRSSSPLGSPDSTFWGGPSPTPSSYRGGGQDPGTPGGNCAVSSSTVDDGPPSPFSPAVELQQAPPNPPPPPPAPNSNANNSVSVISGNGQATPGNNPPEFNRPPSPGPSSSASSSSSSFNFSPSHAFNSLSSPLRSKIKKASSFERFSAQAQASSNNIASNNNNVSNVSMNSGSAGSIVPSNSMATSANAGPGPSRLMWNYSSTSSSSATAAASASGAPGSSASSSSSVRPNFVSSINDPASSSSLPSITKPFHIKKLAAKIASVLELERIEAEAAAAAAAAAASASSAIESSNFVNTNQIEPSPQESLIRRQLSETPLNLTDSSSVSVSRNPVISTNSFNSTNSSSFNTRKIPLTPKQKLLHRMQSGEIIIPVSTTPPPPPVQLPPSPPSPPSQQQLQQQLQQQQQHQLLLASLQQQQPQLLIQDSLHPGMIDDSPPSPPTDRYTNALSNYESFMRATGGDDFSVQDALSKDVETVDGGNNQILYDAEAYNYYYGNILTDEIFNNGSSNGSGGQASSSRGIYLHNPANNSGPGGLPDDVVNAFQGHGSHGGHLEFVLGLNSNDDREARDDELQLADDLSHQQQFLDPNDIAMAVSASKSQNNDSTLRNLLMMDPLVRTHDDSWISVSAAEYQNRMNGGNLRMSSNGGGGSLPGNTASAAASGGDLMGGGVSNNSWMNEWSSPRGGPWQGQGQQHMDREQDEVMDMSVMEIEKTHNNSLGTSHSIIKRALLQQHHAPQNTPSNLSMAEVDLVSERDLSALNSMALPMDLQQPLNLLSSNVGGSLSKNQIMSDPSTMLNSINSGSSKNININPMDLQHHRSLVLYDDEQPVNLMSAVNLDQELAHHHSHHSESPDLNIHDHPNSGSGLSETNSYANVCISGSNIIFTTTSTSTTVAATAAGGFEGVQVQGQHPNFLIPLSDNIDERRIIRVKKSKEHLKDTLAENGSNENSPNQPKMMGKANFIPDKPIQPKSFASLPSVLTLKRVTENSNNWGVIASRNRKIPANAKFGPVEGPLRKVYHEDLTNPDTVYPCLVMVDSSNIIWQLDRTDDELCNWMKFVRRARSAQEQNILISEEDGLLYFTTCKDIPPKTELLLGYGFDYAQKYGFSFMNCEADTDSSSEPAAKKAKKTPKPKATVQKFLCFECDTSCGSTEELTLHLETVHQDSDLIRRPKKNAMKKFYNSLKNAPQPVVTKEKVKKEPAESTTTMNTRQMAKEVERIKELEQEEPVVVVDSSIVYVEADNSGQPSAAPLPPPKVKCTMCYKSFANKERLEKHMMVHSDQQDKPLQCQYCERRYFTNSALAGHVKTHAEENGSKCFECPICDFSTQQLLQLKDHVQTHKSQETGVYTCPRCSKDFGVYSLIRKHIRAFHGPRHFGCEECPMKFPSVDKLRLHQLKHSSFRAYLCAECGKQFKRKDKLTDHTRKVHDCILVKIKDPLDSSNCSAGGGPDEDEDISILPTTPNPKAKDSKKVQPRLSEDEIEKFVFRCLDCMVGFRRRGMLVNHMANRHPDKNLDQVPELNLPITRPAKNYFCPHCVRVYKSSSKRKAHILKNHPGKSIPPQLRGKELKSILEEKNSEAAFDTIDDLDLRETVHVIRKEAVVGKIVGTPHGCQWCHRQYATRAKLLQHQRKHHVELMPPDIQMPRTQKNNVSVSMMKMEDMEPIALSVGLSAAPPQSQPKEIPTNPTTEDSSVIGYYLTTTTVSSEQLGNLLQHQQPPETRPLTVIPHQHLNLNPGSSTGTIITLSIPPGSTPTSHHHHLHQSQPHLHLHPTPSVNHLISNGSQILTKTD